MTFINMEGSKWLAGVVTLWSIVLYTVTFQASDFAAVLPEPQARKHVSGALIADDFNAPQIDGRLWRI
jgi:hypothetical protein